MSTTPVSFQPYTAQSLGSPGGAGAPQATEPPASKEMFLKLFVAQLKYQNPLNPADGVQFLSQLSQFTEMEQLMAMRQDIAAMRKAMEETSAPKPAAGDKPQRQEP